MVFALNEVMIFNINVLNLIRSTSQRVCGEKTKMGDIEILDTEINATMTCRNLSVVTRRHEGQTISREIKAIGNSRKIKTLYDE